MVGVESSFVPLVARVLGLKTMFLSDGVCGNDYSDGGAESVPMVMVTAMEALRPLGGNRLRIQMTEAEWAGL